MWVGCVWCYTLAGWVELNVARMRLTGEGNMPSATEGLKRLSGPEVGIWEVTGGLSQGVFIGAQLKSKWRVWKEGER